MYVTISASYSSKNLSYKMGRKDKNKKKISGGAKTALKTEKKLNAKQKRELATLGEVRKMYT